MLSFAGTLTFGNAGYLREAAALTPVDQLLVETDAPVPDADAAPRPAQRLPAGARTRSAPSPRSRASELAELCASLTATAERVFGTWSS